MVIFVSLIFQDFNLHFRLLTKCHTALAKQLAACTKSTVFIEFEGAFRKYASSGPSLTSSTTIETAGPIVRPNNLKKESNN